VEIANVRIHYKDINAHNHACNTQPPTQFSDKSPMIVICSWLF